MNYIASNKLRSLASISIILLMASCSSSDSALRPHASGVASGDKKVINAALRAEAKLIRSDYKPGELTELCNTSIKNTKQALDQVAAIPAEQRTIDNTLLALEKISADFTDEVSPLTFMGYVSTDEAISAEGSNCESAVGQFSVDIYTRRDLYQSFVNAVARNTDEARLLKVTKDSFEKNGLKLSDEILAQVRQLKAQLAEKETQFSTNLNIDKTSVVFSADELAGLPADYIASLKKTDNGGLIVTTKESDYPLVMQNAVNAETRRKMMLAYLSRGTQTNNSKLLSEAVSLRSKIASLMGYKNWADYKTDGRMAQNGANVLNFLNGLKSKLAVRDQSDLAKLLAFKKELDPSATVLNQSDISYLSYQLQKRDFSLDNEKIREYFPADVVISGLFKVYSEMLGLRFEEVKDAKVWSPDVHLYEIHNAVDDQLIAYFYADFFPRAGKYGHAAAFPLISGRVIGENGAYSLPVASIVANLNPPLNGKPSLLAHDDVVTMFHEFGHIMHQTLTRAPYATLSGSSVAQDFVEAPSQMLENWPWSANILNSLSGHYLDHSKKLPADLLEKMIAAREFNQGYNYTKQLLYALYDMTLHTAGSELQDVNQIYLDLYKQIIGVEPLAGQQFPASFGHLMGGYDAGYYGYLWSEVYAQDMFSMFPSDNLMNPIVGYRYRKIILEKGNQTEALDLLKEFLNREPSADAFFRKLHIQPDDQPPK